MILHMLRFVTGAVMESDCRVTLGRVLRDGLFKEMTSKLSRSLKEENEPASEESEDSSRRN